MINRKNCDALVVDDESDICHLCEELLESMGFFRNIIMCKDGGQATTKINNQNFTLMVIDINIPKKDGLKLIETVSDKDRKLLDKVLVISGALDTDRIRKVVALGVRNILAKPFTNDTFIEKVKSMCGDCEGG